MTGPTNYVRGIGLDRVGVWQTLRMWHVRVVRLHTQRIAHAAEITGLVAVAAALMGAALTAVASAGLERDAMDKSVATARGRYNERMVFPPVSFGLR